MNDNLSNLKEISVSELSALLKRYIEEGFTYVKIKGELGRVSRPASGHIYFDLKDERSVLACIVWRNTKKVESEFIKEGLEVSAIGKLTTFSGQSRYQLIVSGIAPAGAGSMMAMLEKRKKGFIEEGLFDSKRKKVLPFLPKVIGVVTSETGAVFSDILNRLNERFPRRVILWPVPVQGKGSAEKIAEAIIGFNSLVGTRDVPRPDLLIVGRGGGSLEDLWCFNEEIVVRAVAQSEIPVISAVGHETDTTLIDYVSDVRAPTPTAAAEIAVPERKKLLEKIEDLGERLSRPVFLKINQEGKNLYQISKRMENIKYILADYVQRFDILAIRFPNILIHYIQKKKEQLLIIKTSVIEADIFSKDLMAKHSSLKALGKQLNQQINSLLRNKKNMLINVSRLHNSLSYRRTLSRGYTIVRDKEMKLLRNKVEATKEKFLNIEFEEGLLSVEVSEDKR